MSGRREAYPPKKQVGNRRVGPALDSTSAHLLQISVSIRAVGLSLGMEQMGPICFSALSSGGILWKLNVLIWQSFVRFDLVFFGGCIGFGFRLGQARMRSTCPVLFLLC